MKILVLNAGSSSQKSCFYELNDTLPDRPPQPLWEAKIDWTHREGAGELQVTTAAGHRFEEEIASDSRAGAIARMLETLWQGETQVINSLNEIDIVGHRVAPIHNPINLEGIEAIEKILGNVPQVAVFDTAFHSQLPPAAFVYPGPYEWLEEGIRRYGFHGISHQYCARRAAEILNRDSADLRLISCHLGNGCSLAAVRDGLSVDTTMGFTPLDGLMMGSRSGAIDPGIIIHLLRRSHFTAEELDNILNRNSGLKGISGVSSDMRLVAEAIANGNSRAQLALDIYIHRLRAGIGAMLASLGGLDALIFTAGVGENSAAVRAAVCEVFGFIGLRLDGEKNLNSPIDDDVAAVDSAVRVLVIHTQEDWEIARECWDISRR
ncbi:MAG: acetate kinase [Oscillatoriales cyanobacterium]|nr:MAG: acetate kinase [Oscillatoriales cyanobacterium]